MGFKVTTTIEYEYGGDNETLESIQKEELDALTSGSVGIDDIIAMGDSKITVTVVETAEVE